MRRAAGTGDDDLEALLARGLGERIEPLGRAMCGHDYRFMSDARRGRGGGGVLHGFPVGLAAHDDGDRVLSRGHVFAPPWRKKAGDYRGGRVPRQEKREIMLKG